MPSHDRDASGISPQDSTIHWARRAKRTQQEVLYTTTFNLAIGFLFVAEKANGEHTDRWRTLAMACLRYLMGGTPFTLKVPSDVFDAVQSALNQACAQTGFVVPPRPQRSKKSRRRPR